VRTPDEAPPLRRADSAWIAERGERSEADASTSATRERASSSSAKLLPRRRVVLRSQRRHPGCPRRIDTCR